MDKISIIMPVHNGMPHVKASILNILAMTEFPFELIIVESESTDGTKEFLDILSKRDKRIKVFHTKKKGLTAAINYGIKKANDNHVYLTQGDVIIPQLYGRDWLATLYAVYKICKSKGEIGLVTTIGGGGISGPEYIDGLKWIGTWSCFIPREVIKEVGLFDENMSPGDDIDYCYRAQNAGFKLLMADFWVDHHRMTEHNGVDDKEKKEQMAKYFKEKWKIGNTKKEIM